eukprot:scaffold37083_cov216-Skeletonema_dohrnii-CCMP3373.AAC.1
MIPVREECASGMGQSYPRNYAAGKNVQVKLETEEYVVEQSPSSQNCITTKTRSCNKLLTMPSKAKWGECFLSTQ